MGQQSKSVSSSDKDNGKGSVDTAIDWQTVETPQDIQTIIDRSHQHPCIIYKHSPRCGISHSVKERFEKNWKAAESEAELYYVDVVGQRAISDQIAQTFDVTHQSPQALVLNDGKVIFDTSHRAITAEALQEAISST